MPKLMTVEEVADVLRVDEQTVRAYIKDGKISATKMGRRWLIAEDAVSSLLAPKTTGTANE